MTFHLHKVQDWLSSSSADRGTDNSKADPKEETLVLSSAKMVVSLFTTGVSEHSAWSQTPSRANLQHTLFAKCDQ